MLRNLAIFVGIAVVMISCADRHEVVTIAVDPSESKSVVVRPEQLVRLEANDSSMIYDICNMEFVDSAVVIHSRDLLKSFDIGDGRWLGNILSKGDGEDQYAYIGKIWNDNDTLNIFDPNRKSVLKYTAEDKYVGRIPFSANNGREGENPRLFVKSPDGVGFFTINSYTDGTTSRNPKMTYYSPDGKSYALKGREACEGSFLPDETFTDTAKRRVLMWEPLRDTIFIADKAGLYPLYAIDFGKFAMSSEDQNLKYMNDRIKVLLYSSSPKASFIRYVQPYGSHIYFSYATSDRKWHLARFDETSGVSRTYDIVCPGSDLVQNPFFKIHEGNVYVEMIENENIASNPAICVVPLTEFD